MEPNSKNDFTLARQKRISSNCSSLLFSLNIIFFLISLKKHFVKFLIYRRIMYSYSIVLSELLLNFSIFSINISNFSLFEIDSLSRPFIIVNLHLSEAIASPSESKSNSSSY